MARLTQAQRKALPKSDYAMPKGTPARQQRTAASGSVQPKGSYPVPDVNHAKNALARASQSGNSATIAAVNRKVDAKFPGLRQKGRPTRKG